MTARLILKYPEPQLRIHSQPVTSEEWDSDLQQWCQDLRDTMVANAGLGLAAPQVGLRKRIFAVDAKELDNVSAFQQEPLNGVLFFVNPKVTFVEKEVSSSLEACLSVPGVVYKVKRSPLIDLTYTTPDRREVSARIEGEDAVVIQHEYDHLQGRLYVDKLNPFDRKEFQKRFQKPKRQKTDGEIHQLREQRRAQVRVKRKK